jgi:hypothetical protein
MDFTFDLSQTPIIGKRWLIHQINEEKNATLLRRSISLSPADNCPVSGWKRPWMSQVSIQNNKMIIFLIKVYCS